MHESSVFSWKRQYQSAECAWDENAFHSEFCLSNCNFNEWEGNLNSYCHFAYMQRESKTILIYIKGGEFNCLNNLSIIVYLICKIITIKVFTVLMPMDSLLPFIDQLAPIPACLSFYDWAFFCKDVVEESRKLKGKSVGKCSCHILLAGNQRPHSWCSVSLIRFLINYLEVNGRRQWWALLPFLLWHDHNDHAAEVNRTGRDPVLPLTDGTSGAQIRVSDDWCQASLIS